MRSPHKNAGYTNAKTPTTSIKMSLSVTFSLLFLAVILSEQENLMRIKNKH